MYLCEFVSLRPGQLHLTWCFRASASQGSQALGWSMALHCLDPSSEPAAHSNRLQPMWKNHSDQSNNKMSCFDKISIRWVVLNQLSSSLDHLNTRNTLWFKSSVRSILNACDSGAQKNHFKNLLRDHAWDIPRPARLVLVLRQALTSQRHDANLIFVVAQHLLLLARRHASKCVKSQHKSFLVLEI